MKKLTVLIAAAFVVACFAGLALADKPPPGAHYNLNVIGFANCDWQSMSDPTDGCYKGGAFDNSNGHRLFIPIRTKQTRDICTTALGNINDEIYKVDLDKGVKILVTDGADLGPIDFDGTDGLAKFSLPCGQYQVFARALGKPGDQHCLEWNTLICKDLVTNERVPCDDTFGDEKYVLVGAFDVDRKPGDKPHWTNVSSNILPAATGSTVPYDDFLWLVYNNHIRILQLRFYQVAECGS